MQYADKKMGSLHEGPVSKMKKRLFYRWQKRYLVLTHHQLILYKNAQDKAKGGKSTNIPLRDIIIKVSPTQMKKGHAFDIFTSENHHIVFAVDSKPEQDKWIRLISDASRANKHPSERKKTQAEVDKDLLRMAQIIKQQQSHQRSRAIPVGTAPNIASNQQVAPAPNDLISTEERKASLYRINSCYPSSGRADKASFFEELSKAAEAEGILLHEMPASTGRGVPAAPSTERHRSPGGRGGTGAAAGNRQPPLPVPTPEPVQKLSRDMAPFHSISMLSVRDATIYPHPNLPPRLPPPPIPPRFANEAQRTVAFAYAPPPLPPFHAKSTETAPPVPPRPRTSLGGRKALEKEQIDKVKNAAASAALPIPSNSTSPRKPGTTAPGHQENTNTPQKIMETSAREDTPLAKKQPMSSIPIAPALALHNAASTSNNHQPPHIKPPALASKPRPTTTTNTTQPRQLPSPRSASASALPSFSKPTHGYSPLPVALPPRSVTSTFPSSSSSSVPVASVPSSASCPPVHSNNTTATNNCTLRPPVPPRRPTRNEQPNT